MMMSGGFSFLEALVMSLGRKRCRFATLYAHPVAEAQLPPASATLPRPPTLKAVSPGSEQVAARR